MSQIIPSSQIAALLEEKASLAPGEGMEVVRAVFSLIEEQLAAGHNVNIKKLGRFVLTDNEEKPIRFVPDTEYKAVVNAPFEAFEPFHLFADEVQVVEEPLESLETEEPEEPEEPDTPALAIDGPEETVGEESTAVEEVETSVDAEVTEDIPEDITEPEPEPQFESKSEPDTPQPPEVVILPPPLITEEPPQPPAETPPPLTPTPTPTPVQEQPEIPANYREQPVAAKRQICGWQCFWLAIAFIAGLFIGFALGYFNASTIIESFTINDCSAPAAVDTVPRVDTDTVAHMPADTAHTTQAQAPDTARKAVSAPPARAPRYDTITRTTFLTTLARRYYGQMEYWVYIYDANKLGNPNTIAPGTTLLIPYPDQLPLTGNTEADIKAAKKRSAEIYARYQ